MTNGHFRDDLLFRLQRELPVHIPPLRERAFGRHSGTGVALRPAAGHPAGPGGEALDSGAVQLLATYPWPGNVRELANSVERLAILGGSSGITAEDAVARVLPRDGAAAPSTAGWEDVALTEALDRYEQSLITRALSAARGNVADAARRLSTDRANLYRRMRRLGIEPPRDRDGMTP